MTTAPTDVLLRTEGLTVSFGGLHANDELDVSVGHGQFVGLIGPNGAGKTTFIDAISGFVRPSAGRVLFDGRDLADRRPHERARAGLVRTFQATELFEDLDVRDNLLAAAAPSPWYGLLLDVIHRRRRDPAVVRRVDEALAMLELTDVADRFPRDLSHGQRKLVGVARALATAPKLLLLDEPAAGLDTAESAELGVRLRALLDHGVSILLVDHDMGLVLSVCDHLYVLDFGHLIAEGSPAQIRTNAAVVAAYLGDRAGEVQAARADEVRAARAGAPELPTPGGATP